jgi:hypothetical protein
MVYMPVFHQQCSCVQEALLRTQWPLAILDHDNAAHIMLEDVLWRCTQCPRYEYLHKEMHQMLADTKSDMVCHSPPMITQIFPAPSAEYWVGRLG